ncbi:MAG TPA: SRPBCC family protein [Ilumatobacter sp.]
MNPDVNPDVSVTREIAAPADAVWAMVADLTRMGEWSPENRGGKWLRGASGAQPGARFQGVNRNGSKQWKSVATMVDVEPGKRLAFRSSVLGIPIADWAYDLEPTATGCRVTESWTDRRPRWFLGLSARASGVPDRTPYTRAGIEQTLERLAAAAEAAAS